ncbi:hypothetical protein KC333_g8531 [Hortaea werneckii]|nr:hypothetical protein KC333_g8531 [Hortaea werneckii]KAI7311078.1 hypothetical protein KC326_g6412 [Hortaea werneckii]
MLPFNYRGLECPDVLRTVDQFNLLGMDPHRQPRYTYDELLGMARHVASLLATYERFADRPPWPDTGFPFLPYRVHHADAMVQYLESGAALGGPDLAAAAIYTMREGWVYDSQSSWNPHILNPFTSFTITPEVAQPIPGRLPGPSAAPALFPDSPPAPLSNGHVWDPSSEDDVDVNPDT